MIWFVGIYLLYVILLDWYYFRRYQWDSQCILERACTGLIQPLMELIGNRMSAHFWHFKKLKLQTKPEPKYYLKVGHHTNPSRFFGKNRLLEIFSSAIVDVNPVQPCAIIKPKHHEKKWKLIYPTNLNNQEFDIEKCSHIGQAKIVLAGEGYVLAQDESGNWIELEIIQNCKAFERRDVLFI